MPDQTPVYDLPYPLPTDPVTAGADDIHALADRLEEVFSGFGGGGGGSELAYAERTTSVSITATSEATAHTLITAPAVTVDGATPIIVEAYSPMAITPASAGHLVVQLFEGATCLGTLGQFQPAGSVSIAAPLRAARRLTPAAGSHTYTLKAWLSQPGTGSFNAGAGGSGGQMPAFLRITVA